MYTWESLSDPPRKLSMYVLYVMLHAALSGLPLCKRGHTNITFLFGNSFLLSLLLTFSFYSNWYGCQPLLGTQDHPGPKVHTGTVTTSHCPKRQRRAACESKLSSTWQQLLYALAAVCCEFSRHLVATWMRRQSRTSRKTRKTKKKALVVRKRLVIRGSSPKCRGKS